MKKFVILLGILFAMQTALIAQDVTVQNVIFNAHLHSTLNLILVDGGTQQIDFISAEWLLSGSIFTNTSPYNILHTLSAAIW